MATSAFAQEAVRLHRDFHLSDSLISRGVGAARSTVRGWLALRAAPTGMRAERVAELGEIADRLGRVMDSDYVPVWLTKPVEALGNEKPIDVLAKGEYRRVARLISELEDPGAV